MAATNSSALRHLPSVDRILGNATIQGLLPLYGRRLVVTAIRRTLDGIREEVRAGSEP
ncbi:MAG: L-seryl-tRNA(Sec) selenium transferase, partial [Thermoflexia bacterium]